jgi:carboxypeptidase A2
LFKVKFEIVRLNMQEVIDEEERLMKRRDVDDRNIVGAYYARYSEIQNYIDEIVENNPSFATSYISGQSVEQRNLKVIQLGTPCAGKKHIWIDCGIHAREWVSPSTCIFMIDAFVREHKNNDAQVVDIFSKYCINILPLVNPDGYEFTHTSTRLWRKNRRVNSGSTCLGVDLNRNFPEQWMTGGSSPLACSDTYAGPSAGSEPETKAVMNAINRYPGQWAAVLTIHSYGKWWFTTYGYTTAFPPNFAKLNATAAVGINAIASTYNERGWTCGSSSQMLYIASGGTEDWTYAQGIPHSYCLELRPGQSGTDSNFGFQLPPDRAPLAGQETYNGVKAFINEITYNP